MDFENMLTGEVERIIFQNLENGYTVLELAAEDELHTVTGVMPSVKAGETITVMGEFKSHPSFGIQFNAISYETVRPHSSEAILRYLSSGAVKGIGPATAAKLVREFGENTLYVMENEPERISVFKGITKKKAQEISEFLKNESGMREMLLYLSKYNVSPSEAAKIWKLYGSTYLERIEENPYCLCSDIVGIDFYRADAIAQIMERPGDNINRIRAGIIYVLKHNLSNGHTCLPCDKLVSAASKLLSVSEDLVSEIMDDLIENKYVVAAIFNETKYIYLERYFRAEEYIAGRLNLIKKYPAAPIYQIENHIKSVEQSAEIEYAPLQKEAIRKALVEGMLILTGGPGTGKTTTLEAIIRILKEKGETVLLAAPTGRAAKRMSELTGEDAKTIHRLLQVEWDEEDRPVFAKNEKNLLECDALVLDEVSMVDVLLFESVLKALPLGCRLILVGDSDQLPSVAAGNVLSDLVSSGAVPTVALKEIFRQAMQSLIVTNAHKVVNGQAPTLSDKTNDFFFMPMAKGENIISTVLSLCSKRLPEAYDFDSFSDIQVLCPGRKGELGTSAMNAYLQEVLNPYDKEKNELNISGRIFREGDKVIQSKNNYNLLWSKADGTSGEGIFNGDIGTVISIDKRANCVVIQMDDKFVSYDFEQIKEVEHAYALTVHKSQGNEFPAVIIPLYRPAPQLLYRNLLYTAITRAKSLLILVGNEEVINKMIANDKKTRRYSGLCYLIRDEFNG